ncbi:MAG: hypothetical protein E7386_03225 [Ruminococcaceae bacterium]|nr:hypothetical protein [Oscillospiraceae bacterium]
MSSESKEQQVDQLLRGVYRMCVNRDDCNGCPFYIAKCTFGEPKPKTWFDEETIEIKAPAKPAKTTGSTPVFFTAANQQQNQAEDDSEGTWLVSTTMGSVFTKYVFICSKCGYKKESVFSAPPIAYCPECEKRKANKS